MKKYYVMPKWASVQYLKRTSKNQFFISQFPKIVDDFVKSINDNESITILDVGTGPGVIPLQIARKHRTANIIGIDLSPNMIDVANQALTDSNLTSRIHFKVANVIELPFESDSIDYIISTFSIHEWPEPEKSLIELLRVLKIGGKLSSYDLNPHLTKDLKKVIKNDYGWFNYMYLKRISNSFKKTLVMLEKFLQIQGNNWNFKFSEMEILAKMSFNKK